jgi:hypothetical protein
MAQELGDVRQPAEGRRRATEFPVGDGGRADSNALGNIALEQAQVRAPDQREASVQEDVVRGPDAAAASILLGPAASPARQ